MRRTHSLPAFALALAALVAAPGISAQTECGLDQACPTGVAAFVEKTAMLSLGPVVSFGVIGAEDFDLGSKDAESPLLWIVSSNVDWQLHIAADAGVWTGGSNAKPHSDLEWSIGSGFVPISQTDALVQSGAAGGQFVGPPIDFRSLWSWTDDPPGTYELGVNLTLSEP